EGPCVGQIEVCRQHLLQALCFALDLFEPGSFWQPQVDQNFRAIGGREELFWDETEARNADQKRTNGERDDETPPANASRNDRPNDAIGPAVEGAMLAGGPATRLEHQITDPGCEIDSGEPGNDQRDAGHPKQRADVFAGRASRETDRDEAGDGDEGS